MGTGGKGASRAFPFKRDGHLLTVLRYVLRNPVRGGLVEQAAQWPWSSLCVPHLADAAPIPLPDNAMQWIDQPLFAHELTALRTCVNRQQPFGASEWQERIATTLGLEPTLRRRGRPPKEK